MGGRFFPKRPWESIAGPPTIFHMRLALIAAILINISPLPAAAGLLEGKPSGKTPDIKVERTAPQAPTILPGLETVAARLEAPESGQASPEVSPVLDQVFDQSPPKAAVLGVASPAVGTGEVAGSPHGTLLALWHGGSALWKTEVKRKAFHQMILLSIPAYHLIGPAHILPAAAAWVGLTALFETLRLKVPATRALYTSWFGHVMRVTEADRFSGVFYAALGLSLVMAGVTLLGLNHLLVPAAVLTLALGDATSPLVGMRFGFLPYKVMGAQRSVDGTAAAFAVVFAIGLALGFPWSAALAAAAAFSVVDVFPVKPDDNLWIPTVYAATLALLSGHGH